MGAGASRYKRKGVELGVTVADAGDRADQVLDESGVAHEVADGLLANEAGVIEKAAFADADDIGDLRGEQHAGVGAGSDAGRDGLPGDDEGFERHRLGGAIGIVGQAGDFELLGKGTDAFEEFGGGGEFGGAAEHPGALAVIGIVALGAGENGAIGHDAGMAGVAAHGAEFDFTFAADDPAGEGDGAIGGDGHAGFVEGGVRSSAAPTGPKERGELKICSPAWSQSASVLRVAGLKATCGSCCLSQSM